MTAPRETALGLAARWARKVVAIHATGYADRIVERILKIQIGFNLFLAAVAPFGGMDLSTDLSLLLLAQCAATYAALWLVRRRVMALAAPLYLAIAVVTYVEAKRYSGFVGLTFAAEAALALVALWYIVVLLRATSGQQGRSLDG